SSAGSTLTTFETRTLTFWPTAPVNVAYAFWPGTVVVRVTAGPPAVIAWVGSAGTSYAVKLSAPVAAPLGSITKVYVPATGSTVVSRNPPAGPTGVEARTDRSGLRSEMVPLKSDERTLRLTRWFSDPVKVKLFFWPGTVVVPVAGEPSVSAADVSAGTS